MVEEAHQAQKAEVAAVVVPNLQEREEGEEVQEAQYLLEGAAAVERPLREEVVVVVHLSLEMTVQVAAGEAEEHVTQEVVVEVEVHQTQVVEEWGA